MRMRPLEALEIPAGGMTELKSGGAHIMLFGLTGDLNPGEAIDLILTFERAGEVTITAEVHAPGSAPKSMGHDHGEGN